MLSEYNRLPVIINEYTILADVYVPSGNGKIILSLQNVTRQSSRFAHELLGEVVFTLGTLYEECKNLTAPIVSSSDFDYKELSEEDIDSLFD